MDDLMSSEFIDSPELHVPIQALYSCCLDTLKSISTVELQDESLKTYYARLKTWGAGLFTEGPSLNVILEEESGRYRPLLNGLQETLFSIAVEEVVFLKSRRALNGNHDIDLQLEPKSQTLLGLVSQIDSAVLACERRLPHLANTSKISKMEPLHTQSIPSQEIKPSSPKVRRAQEHQSSKSLGARRGLINRTRKKFPATNKPISLPDKNVDTVDLVRVASPLSGEQGLKGGQNASLSQPSEDCHEDYDMYLGDYIESLFDLLPSIRGIRRTRLLEAEFHQNEEKWSSPDLTREVTRQSARTLPVSEIQSNRGNIGPRTTEKQLRPLPHADALLSAHTSKTFRSSSSDISQARLLASELCIKYLGKVDAKDVEYLQLRKGISELGDSLRLLESIMRNAEEQIPEGLRRLYADGTRATIMKTLSEVTGDFNQTLRDCEKFLSNKLTYERSGKIVKSITKPNANDLGRRMKFHAIKILLITEPFESHLLHDIHGGLQLVRNDVAPLTSTYFQETAQSIHPKRPKSDDVRITVLPDLEKRFELKVPDYLPLRGVFDAAISYLANSTVDFEPGSGPGQNIPEATKFLDLLKSVWITDNLKHSDYLRSADSESLWADYLRELEDDISAQASRFDTGELEAPPLDVMYRLPDHCFYIWFTSHPWQYLPCEDTRAGDP